MFGVKFLRRELAIALAKIEKLRGEIEATDRCVDDNHRTMRRDLDLLLAHLKLEINTLPATPERRVVEKAGTQAKRPQSVAQELGMTQQEVTRSIQNAMLNQYSKVSYAYRRGLFGGLFG